MSDRIRQEFYCNDCDGYFLANLSTGLDINVKMVCPSCGREHPRHIKAGLVYDGSHPKSAVRTEEIISTKASYSKKSHMTPMEGKPIYPGRGGVPVDMERWLEVSEREKGNV